MAMIYLLDIEAPPLILGCFGAEKTMDVAVRHFDGVKLPQRCPHVLLIVRQICARADFCIAGAATANATMTSRA